MTVMAKDSAQGLIWWPDAQLRHLERHIENALAPETAGWLGASRCGCAVVARLAHESTVNELPWRTLGVYNDSAAWIAWGRDDASHLAQLMFGSKVDGVTEFAGAIADRAFASITRALRSALRLAVPADTSRQPSRDLFRPWSGGIVIEVARPFAMHLLLEPGCVHPALPLARAEPFERTRAPLVDMKHAIGAQRAAFRVELEGRELDLGSLASLRVGDVLPLPHNLDDPLLLCSAEGETICAGHLGQQGGVKALELAKHLPAPN